VALWLYDFATRRERLATADEEAEYAALVQAQPAPTGPNAHGSAVSSSGGSLAWTEARDPSLQGATPPVTIVAKPQSAPSPIVCEARVCTSQFVGAWRWRNDGELLFNAFAPGSARLDERRLYAWRPGRDKEPRLILSTSGLYDSFAWDCGQAGDKLICFYEELDRPRRLVSIDLDNGAIGTLYDPNPTWARFDLGAPPRVIPVRTASGFEMHSYLVLPPNHRGSERLPLVIVSYVCSGFMRGGSGNEYPVYPLAAQGFAVLCFNLELNNLEAEARGPRSMPPEFAADDGDGFRELVQTGLDAAIDELDRMGVIDPDRVGITGLSAGAQMVEYAIIHRPRLAAAIESGTMLEAAIATTFCSRGGCEFLRQAGFGSPTSERWSTRAMSRNVERIRAPLLVNASDQEALGSVEPIRALQAAGRAAELYVYPDEHHIKWQPAHRLAIYNRNIDWMNFWLRGVESGLTGDPDQYMRWSAMRDRLCRAVKSGGIQSSSGAVRQPGPDKWKSGLAWYCLSDPVATAK
jgi:dipeptidyl aminopeptidase/acylaminoacyl peptidase